MHLRFHSVVVSCVADDSSAHTPFGVLGFLLGTGALPLWLAVPFADDPKEYNRKIWRRKANTKLEEEIEELQIISDVSFLSCLVSRGYDTHNVQAGLFRFIYVFFFSFENTCSQECRTVSSEKCIPHGHGYTLRQQLIDRDVPATTTRLPPLLSSLLDQDRRNLR